MPDIELATFELKREKFLEPDGRAWEYEFMPASQNDLLRAAYAIGVDIVARPQDRTASVLVEAELGKRHARRVLSFDGQPATIGGKPIEGEILRAFLDSHNLFAKAVGRASWSAGQRVEAEKKGSAPASGSPANTKAPPSDSPSETSTERDCASTAA